MYKTADNRTLSIALLREDQASACAALIPDDALDHWTETSIASTIKNTTNSVCLGATLDNKLAGFALMSCVLDEMELLYIAVDQHYSRQGIATALISEALTLSQGAVTKMFLEVRRSNAKAISLYKQLGFKRIGERKQYYSIPPNTILPNSERHQLAEREDALIFSFQR